MNVTNRNQLKGGGNYIRWAKTTIHLMVFLHGFLSKGQAHANLQKEAGEVDPGRPE